MCSANVLEFFIEEISEDDLKVSAFLRLAVNT